jgi:hypothetical protein
VFIRPIVFFLLFDDRQVDSCARHIGLLTHATLGDRPVIFGFLFNGQQANLGAFGIPLVAQAVASAHKSRNGILAGPHFDKRQTLALLLAERQLLLGLLPLAQCPGPVQRLFLVELAADPLLFGQLEEALLGFGLARSAGALPVGLLGLLRSHGRFAFGAVGRTRHEAL